MNSLTEAYRTKLGRCFQGNIEDVFKSRALNSYKGRINLILTSPPFPLNRKKKYGNRKGDEYIKWLSEIMTGLKDYLAKDGSLVLEIGNSWEERSPLMSTLPLETLLAIKQGGNYKLCQQFVWFNTAKLPSPVQWVNIKRNRVKDSFTNIWWMSNSINPKANNRNVLQEYSDSMKRLLKNQNYNAGLRPSEHKIGEQSFLIDHGGSIPSNVLVSTNTTSNSRYLNYCRTQGLKPHPARMPESIAGFFIKFLTDENDLVFDPFSGSNTTGEVSEALRRRWISIEIDSQYVDDSKSRFDYVK
jgi:DNA modification methylase